MATFFITAGNSQAGTNAADAFIFGNGSISGGESYDAFGGIDVAQVAAGATVDFSLAAELYNFEIFRLLAGSTAIFNSNMFNDLPPNPLFLGVVGSKQAIVINNADSFSGFGWQFQNWTPGTDTITINGTGGIDSISGTTQDDIINGGGGIDFIDGGFGGNDRIDGGAGDDVMDGGAGDDTYVVDSAGDVVTETDTTATGGVDTVESSVDYKLGEGLENLILTGTASIRGTGNAGDNVITGNSGNNILNGQAGADTMEGGDGDDTFYVDDYGDTVSDTAGHDTVRSGIDFQLPDGFEDLYLVGPGDSRAATGNSAANKIVGNVGDDFIDGGEGADVMYGGDGDDYFYVDNPGDIVREGIHAGAGDFDAVETTISYTLPSGVEELYLASCGCTNINGTGNSADNLIWGDGGNNRIDGKFGNDVLVGDVGADTFRFSTALDETNNVDLIVDFIPAESDKIELENAIFTGLEVGTLEASAFTVGTAASAPEHRIVYDDTTGNLYFDSDGDGANPQIWFAAVCGCYTISNTDFLVT